MMFIAYYFTLCPIYGLPFLSLPIPLDFLARVGLLSCSQVNHTIPHTELTCVLPSGSTEQSVLVIQVVHRLLFWSFYCQFYCSFFGVFCRFFFDFFFHSAHMMHLYTHTCADS